MNKAQKLLLGTAAVLALTGGARIATRAFGDKGKTRAESDSEKLRAYYENIVAVALARNVEKVMIPEGIMYDALYTAVDGKWNIGFSMTEIPDADGKWRAVKKGDKCTPGQAIGWCEEFFRTRVYPTLIRNLRVSVSAGMFEALADFAYNFASPYNFDNDMIRALNNGAHESEVLKMFSKYRGGATAGPIVRRGFLLRHWLRAAVAANMIDDKKILDASVAGLNEFSEYVLFGGDVNDKTAEYYTPNLSRENIERFYKTQMPGVRTVRDELGKSDEGRRIIAAIEKEKKNIRYFDAQDKFGDAKKLSAAGLDSYRDGDLKAAEMNFRRAIATNPNNIGARNDLAQTLLRQKRYNDAIKIVRQTIRDFPDTLSPAQKAAANYIGGRAREAKGDFVGAIMNYRLAYASNPVDTYKVAIDRMNVQLQERADR